MVCAKCQRLQKKTELVTPSVKHKSDLYFGSPASHDRSKSSATSNASGVAKVSWSVVCILLLVVGLAYTFRIEQTAQQRCKKPIRSLQLHMFKLQDESTLDLETLKGCEGWLAKYRVGRSRSQIMQSMCLHHGQRYVSLWLLSAAPFKSIELTLRFSLRHLWQDSKQEYTVERWNCGSRPEIFI